MRKKLKLVIAGNTEEFRGWCADHQLNFQDYKYISNVRQMYGCRDCVMYRIGNYHHRTDIWEINEYCCLHNIRNAYMRGQMNKYNRELHAKERESNG